MSTETVIETEGWGGRVMTPIEMLEKAAGLRAMAQEARDAGNRVTMAQYLDEALRLERSARDQAGRGMGGLRVGRWSRS